MATIVEGNMMDHFANCDHFVICGGSNLRLATGELVMMRGLDYEISVKFPAAAKAFGKLIKEQVGDCGLYYLMCNNKVGLFQTHILPKYGIDLGIISKATQKLAELAKANPNKSYYLEAMWHKEPRFTCEGFIRLLPENVTIWVPSK